MRPLRSMACLLLGLACLTGCRRRQAEAPPVVAAAADLVFALEEVGQRFRSVTGQEVRFTFGSSGKLAQQIEQGAPFQVFLSADEAFARRLEQGGLTVGEGRTYAEGRLAYFVPTGSPLKPDGTLKDLGEALRDGRLRKLALANPEHAPYGLRAKEALQSAGLWKAAQLRLVLGENASQAATFALSGQAQAGLIAYSLTQAPAFQGSGTAALVPVDRHSRLIQRMVLLKGAGAAAARFYAYLQTEEARRVLARHGFTLPGA